MNYNVENITNDFIKGISVEFADKPLDAEESEYAFWEWPIDKFCNRLEEFASELHEAGITHIFIHFWIRIDDEANMKDGTDNNIRLQNDGYDFGKLFDKCSKLKLEPVVKIMIDHKNNNDLTTPKNTERYFRQYTEITKKILDCDTNNNVKLITIANETGLIRDYANCREYWEEYIAWLRKDYPRLSISMSQFLGDINAGTCNIVDLVDIIGVNYYPSVTVDKPCPSVDDVLKEYYTDDLYALQEYCKNNNKKFMITESGCSCWEYQMQKPEKGNSMRTHHNTDLNKDVTANYVTAACIATSTLKDCCGYAILGLGGNYDPFNYNVEYQLDNPIERYQKGIDSIRKVWGDNYGEN